MSALDDFIHETEHHKIMMAHGTLFLAAREELAQLRLALAERDKTIAEARIVIEGIVDFGYEVTEYTMGNARKWLSAHPAQEEKG